jgi:hypothetical protein
MSRALRGDEHHWGLGRAGVAFTAAADALFIALSRAPTRQTLDLSQDLVVRHG